MSHDNSHEQQRQKRVRPGDVLPMGDWIQRARESVDPEIGAGREVDPAEVPEPLRHLIPLVSRWGFGDSARRYVLLELLRESDPQQVAAFREAFEPMLPAIQAWVDELHRTRDVRDFPAATGPFIAAKLAFIESSPPDEQVIAKYQQVRQAARQERKRRADLSASQDAIRKHDYARAVELLRPYEESLDAVARKRLQIARRKLQR